MNLREGYAATHHANLKWSPDHERAIDKVAASGLCDELGVLLWKAKYMHESRAFNDAKKALEIKHREKFKSEADLISKLIVDQVLHEYLSDKCQWCKGAKEIIAGERRVVCDACGGYGIRKYTDRERASFMKLSMGRVKTLQRHFAYLQNLIGTLDRNVNLMMGYQLERHYAPIF